jgi:hypothetical protein
LSREFPYDKLHLANAYRENELKEHKAVVSQGESRLLVRIRQKGYEDRNFFVSTYADADDAIKRIESERRHGLFVDYTAAHQVTLAELMQRYMDFSRRGKRTDNANHVGNPCLAHWTTQAPDHIIQRHYGFYLHPDAWASIVSLANEFMTSLHRTRWWSSCEIGGSRRITATTSTP